jgi:hypothetical protein
MSRSRILTIVGLTIAMPIAVYAAQAAQKKGSEPAPAKKMDMPMAKSTMTDAQKIASAQSAAPATIAKDATIMDWPDKEGAKMRQLRAGSNGWVCMPTTPGGGSPRVDPMCLDKQWASWAEAFMSHAAAPPKVTGTGIGYMLKGDKGVSNINPLDEKPTPTNQWVVTGPHIMVLFGDLKMLDQYPTDPKNGGPWVMWKGSPFAHLMVPVSPTQAPMVVSK